ncbi:uncharacterized protein F5891DRAFT_1180979 [Suillus fuscotomentosus]|uniref:Uncharacterized protein n=1 Tax=Suillus fuscotomentosus TaxID=1912939 RepID=A0AAD4HTC6_9AGAM|nr:uncharacterized protein F5891DRAFT_1180979 [Suillus fuscotomentosus]KAG1907962.1 hypothetical protein F5891DRAFT_1180979 [Suillus fuscotomentosus]
MILRNFSFPKTTSLLDLPAPVVVEAARQHPSALVPKEHTRLDSAEYLLLHFCRLRPELDVVPNKALFARDHPFIKCSLPSVSCLCVISGYIEMWFYGEAVAAALRRLYNDFLANQDPIPNHVHELSSVPDGIKVYEAAAI